MTALTSPVDPFTVERAAEAAYIAAMHTARDVPHFEPWTKLPDYWKRIYRVQAQAVIEVIS